MRTVIDLENYVIEMTIDIKIYINVSLLFKSW